MSKTIEDQILQKLDEILKCLEEISTKLPMPVWAPQLIPCVCDCPTDTAGNKLHTYNCPALGNY